MMDAAITPPLTPPETLRFDFVPRPGLAILCIVNFLLGIVTLSLYRFWAKTNVRKHIWSCVHINGEPLEYTGTGKELFLGALFVFLCLILPIVLLSAGITFYYGPDNLILPVLNLVVVLFIYVMMGYALYKARKYQLSRTNWRGIRGTLSGSAMIYSLTFFGSLMAASMSFGWATPVMNTVLQEQIISDMRFGDAAFKFKGKASPLYPIFALCWFLTLGAFIAIIFLFSATFMDWFGSDIGAIFAAVFELPEGEIPETSAVWAVVKYIILFAAIILAFSLLIPMIWSLYSALELRTFANYTRFDGAQFKLDATAGSIVQLTAANLLLWVFTLGIATPYIQQRNVRYVIDRLTLNGAIDVKRIQQSQVPLDKRGEGFADAFDIGGL